MSSSPHAATRVQISPSVYVRSFGEELILLDFSRGEYFGLDEAGAFVWRGLEEGKSLGEVTESVATHFEVSRDVAYEDVVALVAHMRSQSLLTF